MPGRGGGGPPPRHERCGSSNRNAQVRVWKKINRIAWLVGHDQTPPPFHPLCANSTTKAVPYIGDPLKGRNISERVVPARKSWGRDDAVIIFSLATCHHLIMEWIPMSPLGFVLREAGRREGVPTGGVIVHTRKPGRVEHK